MLIITNNQFFAAPTGNLFLDDFPGAVFAYSLRKLRTAYAGSAMEARRVGDNALQDVGFSGDDFDSTGLETFLGANSGRIRTWYDQTGNGNNALQTTNGDQPAIAVSGTTIVLNGRAALDFDGTDDHIDTGAITAMNTDVFTVIAVAKLDTAPERTIIVESNYTSGASGNSDRLWGITGNFVESNFDWQVRDSTGANIRSQNAQDTNQNIFICVWTSADQIRMYFNGTAKSLESGADASPAGHVLTRIGARSNSSSGNYHPGEIQEIIVYDSDQTSNVSSMVSNIQTYYNL